MNFLTLVYGAVIHGVRFYNLTKVTHIWIKYPNHSDSSTFTYKNTPKVEEIAGHPARDQPDLEVAVTRCHLRALAPLA